MFIGTLCHHLALIPVSITTTKRAEKATLNHKRLLSATALPESCEGGEHWNPFGTARRCH